MKRQPEWQKIFENHSDIAEHEDGAWGTSGPILITW